MTSLKCKVLLIFFLAFWPMISFSETAEKLPTIEPNDDGLYTQSWFLDTFLDVRDDMKEAESAGKQLVILFEQKGCPYCKEIHRVNLQIPEVVNYIRENFHVVQMNLWGDKEATDLDGEILTEKKLGRKWGVQFTPTLIFLPLNVPANAISGRDAKVWTLLGYWKPFHFKHSFQYVKEKGFETEPNFQRWLQSKAEHYEKEGKTVKIW